MVGVHPSKTERLTVAKTVNRVTLDAVLKDRSLLMPKHIASHRSSHGAPQHPRTGASPGLPAKQATGAMPMKLTKMAMRRAAAPKAKGSVPEGNKVAATKSRVKEIV